MWPLFTVTHTHSSNVTVWWRRYGLMVYSCIAIQGQLIFIAQAWPLACGLASWNRVHLHLNPMWLCDGGVMVMVCVDGLFMYRYTGTVNFYCPDWPAEIGFISTSIHQASRAPLSWDAVSMATWGKWFRKTHPACQAVRVLEGGVMERVTQGWDHTVHTGRVWVGM